MIEKIIIAAIGPNRVIGINGKIPWHIADDLKLFKKATLDNTVLMGRNTYKSILEYLGKPLPERNNIVLSRTMPIQIGIYVCKSLDEAFKTADTLGRNLFIIGGAQLYEATLPIADRMFISHVKSHFDGDTFFPNYNERDWIAEERVDYPDFEWVNYMRLRT